MRSFGKIGIALALGLGALGIGAAASAHESDHVSLTVRVSDSGPHGRYDRDGRGRYDRGHEYRGKRVVKSRVYDTRYRARIYLVETVYPGRRGSDRVCTIDVRGPEARYVPRIRLRHIANTECSRHSQVRFT